MKCISPAKINLFLHVIGRRTDGYHDLLTLMCPLDLHDTISLTFPAPQIRLACSDTRVPADHTNLAHRAASLFFNRWRQASPGAASGVNIFIEKNIPLAAGLGGGSSNAAAVLMGLNRHFGHPLSMDALMELGLSVGADVPFFLFAKPALATGVGEKLEAYTGLKACPVVLINPGFAVSTAMVYNNLNLGLTKCRRKINIFSFDKQVVSIDRLLYNDLESVTISMFPELAAIKQALIEQGALGALMSGSGPTIFGIFADPIQARNACRRLTLNNGWRVMLTRLAV